MPTDQIIVDQALSSALMSLPAQQPKQRIGCRVTSSAGFTLVELIAVTGIIAVLATLAIPTYRAFVEHAKNSRTMTEIRILETEINDYQVQFGVLPANLTVLNRGTLKDPWGHGYIYSTTPARRYGLDFLNDDYDLFSKGKDGLSEDLVHVLGVGGLGSDDLLRGAGGAFLGSGAAWVGEE
jgi:prepilin-type N-terminal cleavage/methylation domain-containing protein